MIILGIFNSILYIDCLHQEILIYVTKVISLQVKRTTRSEIQSNNRLGMVNGLRKFQCADKTRLDNALFHCPKNVVE